MDINIRADLYRIYPVKYSFRILIKGLRNQGFRYMFILRKAASANKKSLKWYFFRIILRHYTYKYGFQIPYNTRIGPGFFIGHFGTLVISDKATFGKNCNIAHCVTVGHASRGKRKGAPTIGDFVWIGTGSIIVGNIKIGNHILIAPGSYVNFDVPDHSIVLGNPGKIIVRQNPTEGYINNHIN
jgi:serine O-acetyltransferase